MLALREMWRRITFAARWKTRYARALEAELACEHAERSRKDAEIARLRDENRALLNSILGIAGIPPVFTNSAEAPRSNPSVHPGPEAKADSIPADTSHPRGAAPASGPPSPLTSASEQAAASIAQQAGAAARAKKFAQVAAPMRRRSWQQINRALEFEAARKKPDAQRPAGEL